jgi:hypothetical protein
MSDEQAAAKAAQAILRRLQSKGRIETERPDEVARELVRAFLPYEHEVDGAVANVLAEAPSLAIAQEELERRTREAEAPLDEEAMPILLEKLSAILLASEHVEELFVDDAELSRIVRAALLDYLPDIASQARAKVAAAFVKPRATLPEQKRARISDDGYPFPLFEGPLESANVDDAGPCAFCSTQAEVRFAKACYACFRAGKAVSHVMDTELGMVRAEDAEEGLTHGFPKSAAPPGYELVEMRAAAGDTEPWVRVRMSEASLTELLRTPKYETWQGERWLFCCTQPRVFVGPLKEALLERLRETQETQEEVVGQLLQVDAREAHRRTTEVLKGRISMYVFRCTTCKKHRAHWDCA